MNELVLVFEADARSVELPEQGLEHGERNPTLKVLWKIAEPLEVPASELVRAAEKEL